MVAQKSVLLLPQPSNSINLLNEFKQFRDDRKFLDISLVCENGVRVQCHSMVLATSNSFWRGVLKSLEELGYHGIDEGNLIEILMPELVGEEVEMFIERLYDPERFVMGKSIPNKIFLLEAVEETDNASVTSHKESRDLLNETPTRDSNNVETELSNSEEIKIKDVHDSTSEFDSILDERNGEKEEPMDDHDSETETEIKDDDNDNFEEESEDEDAPLAENTVTPGSFKIVDSIVCLGTEPDKAMVILQKDERDSEVIHQAVHCLCHLAGFDFRRFYRKVMDEALGFHRPSQQITPPNLLCSEERKQIKASIISKMRALRKEGVEIAPPLPPREELWNECNASSTAVKTRPWFKSYTSINTININCKINKNSRKIKKLPLGIMHLKDIEEIGKAELNNDQLKFRHKFSINWKERPQDSSPGSVVQARTGKQFHTVIDNIYKMVTELVSLETLQMALKICPSIVKGLAKDRHSIETAMTSECLFKYTCNICGATFSRLDKNKFQNHKKEHDPTCHICGLKFLSAAMLEAHKNVTHRPPKKFSCNHGSCSFKAATQKALDNHVTRNHKEFVACSKCGDIHRSSFIKFHEKHCGVKKPCPHCGKLYGSMHIKTHIQLAHADEEGSGGNFPCDTCGRTFNNKANLGRHVDRIHKQEHEKKYQCKTCGRGFMTLDAMESHDTVHTGEKPKACRFCDKRYKSSSTTRHHERTKHPELYVHRIRKKKMGLEKFQFPNGDERNGVEDKVESEAIDTKAHENQPIKNESTSNLFEEQQEQLHRNILPPQQPLTQGNQCSTGSVSSSIPTISSSPQLPMSHVPNQQQPISNNHPAMHHPQHHLHPLLQHLPFGAAHPHHPHHSLHLPPHMQHLSQQ